VLPAAHGAVWLRSVRSEAAPLAASLAVYFTATIAVTELGDFPVPVVGAGAGPVLGWYSLLGILQLIFYPDFVRKNAGSRKSHRRSGR
jgi:hypothetical protein